MPEIYRNGQYYVWSVEDSFEVHGPSGRYIKSYDTLTEAKGHVDYLHEHWGRKDK